MECQIVELLTRIHRLSEIALEFHGEHLGEVAQDEVVNTAFDLSLVEEEVEDEEEDDFFEEEQDA
jgi:hypothetical protein